MSTELPKVPQGTGHHPIALLAITATDLAASSAFYSKTFGWQFQPMSSELTVVIPPAGPAAALRANLPAGFPAVVPFIRVPDVEAVLSRVEAAGGAIEKDAWSVPLVGKLARFKDPSGTIYGLAESMLPVETPRVPMPLGSNPRPPANAICSLEMYAVNGAAAAKFFGELFGWGAIETMSQYMAFDPGKGIGGVFQSHTPGTPAMAYIYADDVEAKLRDIEAAGGKKLGDPMSMPGVGCFGYFNDVSGTGMGLIGPCV